MDTKSAGLALLVVAAVLAVIGLALIAGLLNWFGKLPGDLRLEGDNVGVPITRSLATELVLVILHGRLDDLESVLRTVNLFDARR